MTAPKGPKRSSTAVVALLLLSSRLLMCISAAAAIHEHSTATQDPVCAEQYHFWMADLSRSYATLVRAAQTRDEELFRRHPEDIPQELGDPFDQIASSEVGSEAEERMAAENALLEEHVGGGKITREELMLRRVREYQDAQRRSAATISHRRISQHSHDVERRAANNKQARRGRKPVSTYLTDGLDGLLDAVALILLMVIPWRMVLEMKAQPIRKPRAVGAAVRRGPLHHA